MEIEERIPSPPLGERGRGEGDVVAHTVPPDSYSHALHSDRPPNLYPSPPEGERDSQIVEIARSWIGTPYVHQASVKGAGCDCLGLLRGIWREIYGAEPEEVPPYSLDWAEATGAETLYLALNRHACEIPLADLAPGDVALFRMSGSSRATASRHARSRSPAKHCGIVAGRRSAIGNRQAAGIGKSFAECRPPDAGLTLIHARQNKRVSEEPLSAFWRNKLAFAFRL